MAKFLLIHGSCHGAWCWRDMLPLLNAHGHTAHAIDLPAHGDDTTAIKDCTLDGYADAVINAIDEPVILVGHSLAGVTISTVAERRPDLVDRLVYLCSWLPNDGMSAKDMRASAPRQPLMEAVVFADDKLSTTFAKEYVLEKFYSDCPEGTLEFALQNLCPEPTAPSATPVSLSPRFASVPRSYIRCANDQAIPPEFQSVMAQQCKPEDRYEMDCAHSPFFAQPVKLAKILFKIAEAK